jgi:hypothetical protein
MEGRPFKPLARHGAERGQELIKQATRRAGTVDKGARQSQDPVKK